MNMLETAYSGLVLLTSLALGPIFALHQRGRRRLLERYGFWDLDLEGEDLIWLHGASLGEIKGLLPVLSLLRKLLPESKFLVTAVSPSGLPAVESLVDHVRLLPFDHVLWLKRALSSLSPRCLIISETELWPTLFDYATSRSIPIYLVNALVSDHTFFRYRLIRSVLKRSLQHVRLVLAASIKDRERLEYLGAMPQKSHVVGNSKYDQLPSLLDPWQRDEMKEIFFPGGEGPFLVLGSIRPGEELIWFPAIADAIASNKYLSVVVAPRHKEKFDYFAKRLERCRIPFERWSRMKVNRKVAHDRFNVLLLDTLGDLERVYSFATAAFIGGTVVNWGGHNPLEAAAYGAALIVGQYTHKIASVVDLLKERNAIRFVGCVAEARRLIAELQHEPESFRIRGERAQEVWRLNIGAAQRIVGHIKGDLIKVEEAQ